MAFGQYSSKQGQEYIEGGFRRLNADDTAVYDRLTKDRGMDRKTAYEAIRAINAIKAPEDGSKTRAQVQRDAIMDMDLSWEDKELLDRELTGGDEMVSYIDRDSFEITNTVKASQQKDAFALRRAGLDMETAKRYAAFLDENRTTYTMGEDGKYHKDSKGTRLKKLLSAVQEDKELTGGQKDTVIQTSILPALGKKYTGEYAGWFTEGVDAAQVIDAQAAYNTISEEVNADTSIHENDRKEYTNIRFAQYLEKTGMTREQQDRLWYFQSHDESDFKEPWSEIIRGTTEKEEKAAVTALEKTGMDELTYKIILSGIYRFRADKGADGEPINGSAKAKKIEYVKQWDITDEQRNLIMKAAGSKYGMGEKPRKGRKGGSGKKGAPASPKKLKTMQTLPTTF